MARSYESYVKHLRFYGPEGLLEAAQRDLSESELVELEKLVKAAPKQRVSGRRRR